MSEAVLTDAQHQQRIAAARASAARRHAAETTPSVRQGSTGGPSKAAIGLFRQGQARRDTSNAGRGSFDTRTTEQQAGKISGTLKLHFPKAYRSDAPDPPTKRISLARRLAVGSENNDTNVSVVNPDTFDAAMRHAPMRELVQGAMQVVRDHQAGAIERGMDPRGPGRKPMIPEGTQRGLVVAAYKHAALMALHKAGLVDWDFSMDDHTKRDMRPLVPFMRYAQRRVFDQLNVQLKGKWTPFRQEFGSPFADNRTDKSGAVRYRMRPNQEFVKVDVGSGDPEEVLAKVWTHTADAGLGAGAPSSAAAMGNAIGINGQKLSRFARDRVAIARAEKARGGKTHRVLTPAQQRERQLAGRDERVDVQSHRPAPLQGTPESVRGLQLGLGMGPKAGRASFSQGSSMQAQPSGAPKMNFDSGAQKGMRLPTTPVAGAAVKTPTAPGGGFGGGARRLGKIDGASARLLEKVDFGERTILGGDWNQNPATELRRAMHPRMRRARLKLRLNANRGLKHQLNGGVTRTERWQLGLTKANGRPLTPAELEERREAGRASHKLVQPAQLVAGTLAGLAAGTAAHKALKKPVTRYAELHGRLAQARFRAAARNSGAAQDPQAARIVHSQGKLLRHLVTHGTKAAILGTLGTGALLAGDYAGDYAARRVFGAKGDEDKYRHLGIVGLAAGPALAFAASRVAKSPVTAALRRAPGKLKLLGALAGFGGAVGGEVGGNFWDHKVGASKAIASTNRFLKE